MSVSNRVWITPLCQKVIGKAFDIVVSRLSEGDQVQIWESLKTLYHVSPLDVKKECKHLFEEISREAQIYTTPRSLRTAEAQVQTTMDLRRFFYQHNYEFLDLLVETLDKKGYYKPKGITPLRPSKKKMEVPNFEVG